MGLHKERYETIDGLRAYSAIGIILMHVLTNGNYGMENFIFSKIIPSFTDLVFLFMIISGFSLCCGYYEKFSKNQIDINQFYKKRYQKIWPYFAFLCILDLIFTKNINSFYETIANLTLCFGFLSEFNISVVGVGWFLGIVFIFYFMFPFFCFLLSDKKTAWLSFFAAFIINYMCVVYFKVGRTNFAYSMVFFFAGGMLFLYKEKLKNFSRKNTWLIKILIVLSMILYYKLKFSTAIILIMFSLMLIDAIGNSENRFLYNPMTKFLSSISLELYLCHMVCFRIIEKMGLVNLFLSDELSYVFCSLLTIAAAIVFTLVSKKFLNYINNIIVGCCQLLYKKKI